MQTKIFSPSVACTCKASHLAPLVLALLLCAISRSALSLDRSSTQKDLGPVTRLAEYPAGRMVDGEKVERKITIIVDDDDSSLDLSLENVNTKKSARKPKTLLERSRQNECEVHYHINETTKIIQVDETNESGLLIGEIKTGNKEPLDASVRSSGSHFGSRESLALRDESATNYSLFLVSRDKNHIAIAIEIEEIDFEPIVNCEYQELRFSIVGEISKQVLSRKNNSSDSATITPGDEDILPEDGREPTDQSAEPSEMSDPTSDKTSTPPLPVSEAMALLLNSPLNKTILEFPDENNNFRIIDATIDFLYQETCSEQSKSNGSSSSQAPPNAMRNNKSKGRERESRGRSRRKQQAKVGKSKYTNRKYGTANTCQHDNQKFKNLIFSKLNDFFEWDDFKIVCGKIKRLIIPMRSLKISVYSDEFAPNSKFALRYKFIKDPSLLPAQDNGKYFCRNRNVIDLDMKCNGYDDCGDASDESIKICGYPSNKASDTPIAKPITSSAQPNPVKVGGVSKTSPSRTNRRNKVRTTSTLAAAKRKLTYFSGDVLHCCQSSDWTNAVANGQSSQTLNLQSLVGESMKLFSGPLFAPTKSTKRLNRHKRIVGGGVAHKGAWPGQASLQYELLEPMCHFCAGTLVHPMYVLTAGHCITKDGLNRGIKVVFGAHDLREMNRSHVQVRYVDDALIYPGVDVKRLSYDWENDMNNDVALLRLNAPVLVSSQVAPACLPPFNTPLAINTSCRSIGWGQTHGSGSSNLLKHLPLKVVESSACSKELLDRDSDQKRPSKFASVKHNGSGSRRFPRTGREASEAEVANVEEYSNRTMICVNNDLGHGICQGDSGGPLYCDRITSSGERCSEIYGVASFIIQYATVGAMCAVENLPGIFGEVSSKTEWISSTIKMFEQSYRLKYS